MRKRPPLYLIDGGVTGEQRGFYRLRQGSAQKAPAQESWPRDGEWRALIRRLIKDPAKS